MMLNASEKTAFNKLVRERKDYGFPGDALTESHLARFVELELVQEVGQYYQVTPFGVELYGKFNQKLLTKSN